MKFLGYVVLVLVCIAASMTGGFVGGIGSALYLMNG